MSPTPPLDDPRGSEAARMMWLQVARRARPPLPSRPPVPPLGAHHVLEAERRFGRRLPTALRSSYGVEDFFSGRLDPLPGIHDWFGLPRSIMEWEVRTLSSELSARESQPLRGGSHGAWHARWFPLGHADAHHALLCVDLRGDPGAPGRLIVVPDRPGDVTPLNVMPSLTSYLVQVHAALANGSLVFDGQWLVASNGAAFTFEWLSAQTLSAGQAADPWRDPPRRHAPASLDFARPPAHLPEDAAPLHAFLRRLAPAATEPASPPPRVAWHQASPRSLSKFDEPSEDWLDSWCHWVDGSDSPPVCLVVDATKRDAHRLLQHMACRLLKARGEGADTPLPLHVDLQAHAGARSLEAVVEADILRRGGQPGEGALMLQAVRLGHALLLLGNAHAVLHSGGDVWTWCRHLLPTRRGDPAMGRGARLVVACGQDTLPHSEALAGAVTALTPCWDFERLSVHVATLAAPEAG